MMNVSIDLTVIAMRVWYMNKCECFVNVSVCGNPLDYYFFSPFLNICKKKQYTVKVYSTGYAFYKLAESARQRQFFFFISN